MNINKESKDYINVNNYTMQIQQVLTVAEIQKILKISRTMSYALVNSEAFPVIKVGRTIRIPAKTFQDWLYNTRKENYYL